MQFQVPQFIETEDKIIGPLTLKQFGYLAGGGFFLLMLYYVLEFWLWIIVAAIVGLFVIAMAFLKYHGRSFMVLFFAMISYLWRPRLFLWQSAGAKPAVPQGGLSILGFKLNTFMHPLADRREKPLQPSFLDHFKTTKERFEVFRKLTGDREVARRIDYR